jgi:hypothetical protein
MGDVEMLRINKDNGEIVFSYDNSGGVWVQGRITYMVLDNKRVTFTLTAQTAKLNYEVRDIGMLLAAIGTDLMVESKQSEVDGHITPTEARRRSLNGE